MPIPTLSIAERHNIDTGSWFAKFSPALRQANFDCALVRRLHDGELRAEPTRLVVLSREKLLALSESH